MSTELRYSVGTQIESARKQFNVFDMHPGVWAQTYQPQGDGKDDQVSTLGNSRIYRP